MKNGKMKNKTIIETHWGKCVLHSRRKRRVTREGVGIRLPNPKKLNRPVR